MQTTSREIMWFRSKARVQRCLRRLGFELRRVPALHEVDNRRALLLRRHRIDEVFDCGANIGGYGERLRRHGYAGRIVSIEPLREPYQVLHSKAERDGNWEARQVAIADSLGSATMNVSLVHSSSSLLQPTELLMKAAPQATISASETVDVTTLDEIALGRKTGSTMIKLDLQGGELSALRGGAKLVDRTAIIEVECSLQNLYEGQTQLVELLTYLGERSFQLASIEPGLVDSLSGELLQVDAIFVRRPADYEADRT